MSRKVAIEQYFVFNLVRAHVHAHGLISALNRRQRNAGPARSQNDWRYDYVQPVKATRREETGHGVGATFDQYSAHPAITECGKDGRRRKVPIGRGQPKKLNAWDRSSEFPLCAHHDATDTILPQDLRPAIQAAVRIDDNADRLRTGDPAYGQLRIIGQRGTDPDNNRVDQSPQPVEMGKAGRPVDIFRMPRFCRNAAIERLSDLTNNHQLIDGAQAQRAENFTPGLRKGLVTGSENVAKLQPWVG